MNQNALQERMAEAVLEQTAAVERISLARREHRVSVDAYEILHETRLKYYSIR
jgi:hypothetical protein